ncbi:uncharacterized protein LOC123528668 [Mercenaria mercenaria]|uniref:uncharacterized protein LOC123528668 n=1 Tax=Mercenaria mercenaria TaxID=6596 RepID=UPI00234F81F5|nr:uncharacterized protein LOC123528668 [Mercenaria mercenaria]
MITLVVSVFVVLLGYFGGQSYGHDGGWDGNRHGRSRMCPSEDPETHRCYELKTHNSTCIVTRITGCDPKYTYYCKLMVEYEEKPCTVYTCSHRGCCEGYIENRYGSCVSEEIVEALNCENGGTKTSDGFCRCPENFRGKRCEKPVCGGTCLNGGRCEVEKGEPKCICPSSLYNGTFCETVSCEDSCLNGGQCHQDGVLSRCKCTHGYQGDRCQYPINEKCPFVQSRSRASCGTIWNDCEFDLDCGNDTDTSVCCYNGCNGECRVPELEKCTYKGKIYNSGETFSPDTCKKCVCQMYGEVTCSEVECPEKRCPYGQRPIQVEEHCCKVCPDQDLKSKEAPRFTNCPEQFIVLNVSENGDDAHLPPLNLQAEDAYGSKLAVSYIQTEFHHSRKAEIRKNIHIVTAYSDCDSHGRRAECNFKVIVRDPFPPEFKSCPADVYADENDVISWDEPVISDNVDVYNIRVGGDYIRNRYMAVGTYPISYTVWDYDMNQAICAFLVHIVQERFYEDHEDRYPRYGGVPAGTIVGIVTGLIIACGLCVCFTVRVRQLRREQDEEQYQSEQNPTTFSVYDPSCEQNPNVYENIDMKLPDLPEYSPASDPPSYDQIEHSKAYDDAEKVVRPTYEEISTPTSALETNQYENMPKHGEENNAYLNESS